MDPRELLRSCIAHLRVSMALLRERNHSENHKRSSHRNSSAVFSQITIISSYYIVLLLLPSFPYSHPQTPFSFLEKGFETRAPPPTLWASVYILAFCLFCFVFKVRPCKRRIEIKCYHRLDSEGRGVKVDLMIAPVRTISNTIYYELFQ